MKQGFLAKLFKRAQESNSDAVFCGYDQVSEQAALVLIRKIMVVVGNVAYRNSFLKKNSIYFIPGCLYGELSSSQSKLSFSSKL